MKRVALFASLIITLTRTTLASEEAPSVKDIASNIWHDQRAIVTSPLRMNTHEPWILGATSLTVLALIPEYNGSRSFDERLVSGVERENRQYGSFFKRLTYLGDGSLLFSASIASYGISSLGDYEGAQRFSARWIEALVDTTIWVTAIKMAAGRNRPESTFSRSAFSGPGGYFKDQGVNSSFPSGHAALAFATAAVFTRESDNNPWVAVPAYVVAGGVGFSRMYVEKHWLSDVLVGALLGHSIAMLVENRRHSSQKTALRLAPVIDPEKPGLSLVYQW